MKQLRVYESYTRDVGRGVARIDYESMDTLGISTGNAVLLNKKTAAVAFPLYPSDEGKTMIRTDNMVRTNAGVKIGDEIEVEPTKVEPATLVMVMAREASGITDVKYLVDVCEGMVVMQGDKVLVPYFGGRITYQIVSTNAPIVKISQLTKIVESKDEILMPPPEVIEAKKREKMNLPPIKKIDYFCAENDHANCYHKDQCQCACHSEVKT